MKKLRGMAVSPGISIGKALVYVKEAPEIPRRKIGEGEVEGEISRFHQALEEAKAELQEICQKARENIGEEEAAIFEAHIMMLEDPTLIEAVEKRIRSGLNAEAAVKEAVDEISARFEAMESEYFRERAADVRDVGDRVIRKLLGLQTSLLKLPKETIVVARDLMPSDTAQMDRQSVLGFATELGGKTSHTAILARALKIPAVVGISNLLESVSTGETIIVDGNEGLVVVEPDEATLRRYMEAKREYEEYQKMLMALKELPAETPDGRRVELAANVGNVDEVDGAVEAGAEGIGLLRTEFLYLNRETPPTEEEQYKAYRAIVERMKAPVIIRTLDVGGDKPLPYIRMPEEANPFLGWRAIRLCLDEPELFKTQLRAILRASAHGKVRVMFPMVADIDEVREAKKLLREAMDELREEGVKFDESLEVGIMVETPAAAVMADVLAGEVDFFSIGTNDLTQYTMAADRTNNKVARIYNHLHPSVLRLIRMVVDAAHSKGRWVGVCGEMAGDPQAIPILLGLDIDELSMAPQSIPEAKHIIRSIKYKEAKRLAEKALAAATLEEVLKLTSEALKALKKKPIK